MHFDYQIFGIVFCGMIIGHGIGEFCRKAYRRWKENHNVALPGPHYQSK